VAVLLIQVTLTKHIRLKPFYLRWYLRICEKWHSIFLLLLRRKPLNQGIKVILCKIDPIRWRHVHDHNIVLLFLLYGLSLLFGCFSSVMRWAIRFVLVENDSIRNGDFTLDHLLDLVVCESVDLHWGTLRFLCWCKGLIRWSLDLRGILRKSM
jgi:hypothetical protein